MKFTTNVRKKEKKKKENTQWEHFNFVSNLKSVNEATN
jgi:hypothetical protein